MATVTELQVQVGLRSGVAALSRSLTDNVTATESVTPAISGSRPAALFRSIWGHATGQTDDALLDGASGSRIWNVGGQTNYATDLNVVTAASLSLSDSPTPNVLKVLNKAGTTRSAFVAANGWWPSPQVGDVRYVRMYWRNDIANDEGDHAGAGSWHPMQMSTSNAGSEDGYSLLFSALGNGTQEMKFSCPIATFPKSRWIPYSGASQVFLNKFAFYGFEFKMTKTSSNTYSVDARIYNSNGTTIYDSTSIKDASGNLTIGASGTGVGMNDTALNCIVIGTNGGSQLAGLVRDEPTYWAAVCIRSDDWCGPYNSTDG